ncbi:MAG TPA: hypothetical protein VF277_10630 [Steroidobacteraceae bacterium]
MARRPLASNELQPRTHLAALAVATAIVDTLSFVGEFLAMTGVPVTDGPVLYRVFPAPGVVYTLTRTVVGRCDTGRWRTSGC